jgi:hypothetical protein
MSNEKNTIDELFKNKLGDYSLDVPEIVWKNIEAKRTPLYRAVNFFKGKRGVTVGAILLLAVAATAIWATSATHPVADEKTNQTLTVNTIEATPATTASPVAQTQANSNTNGSAANNAPIQATTTANNNTANHSTAAIQTSTQTNNNKNTTTSATTATNGNEDNNNTNTANNTAPTNNQAEEVTTPTNNNTQSENNSTQTQTATLPADDANNNPIAASDVLPAESTIAAGTEETEGTDAIEAQQKTTIKPDNSIASKFSIDAYTSIDFAGRHLSASGVSTNYLDAKKHAESFSPGYSAGLRVNYAFNKAAKLRVGLQYSQLNEKLNYNG